jgi:hypothetical protein
MIDEPLHQVPQLAHVARGTGGARAPSRPRERSASGGCPVSRATAAAKCSTSAGMSSARSRNAGTAIGSRPGGSRGPRGSVPPWTAFARSRLVAAITRTST